MVGAEPSRWIDRVGAALASPRRALADADRPEAAGRAPADLALLVLVGFVAIHLDAVTRAGWLVGHGEIRDGLGIVVGRLGAALQAPLVALLAGAVAITAAAGRKRSLGRDSDLACAAFLPAVVAVIAGALIAAIASADPSPSASIDRWIDRGAAVVGLAAYAASALLAIVQARFHRDSEREPWRGGGGARIAGLAVAAVVAGLLVLNGVRLAGDWSQIRPKISGDPAPAFALPRIEAGGELGDQIALGDLRGKVLVVDFWATWCGPCRASMPQLEILARRPGVELVSINIEGADKRKAARQLVDRLAPSALLLADTGGAISETYGVSTLPHLAIIDGDGVIRHVHRGGIVPAVRRQLASVIEQLQSAF